MLKGIDRTTEAIDKAQASGKINSEQANSLYMSALKNAVGDKNGMTKKEAQEKLDIVDEAAKKGSIDDKAKSDLSRKTLDQLIIGEPPKPDTEAAGRKVDQIEPGAVDRVEITDSGRKTVVSAKRDAPSAKLPPLSPNSGGRSISPSVLRVGDIILSTTNAPESIGVRLATLSPVSHAVLFVGNPDEVVESIKVGVIRRSLDAALADDTLAVAFRVPDLTDGEAQLVANYAAAQVGKKYDFWSAFTAAVPWWSPVISPLIPPGPILRRVHIGTPNSTFFCSELVIEAFKQAGHPLTTQPSDEVLPDDIPALGMTYIGHLKP
jgi:hypothetical protein